MSEISRIQGPSGPTDPGSRKDKVPSDSEKFKELMKVQKVREVDPEEQKKRKRREESEEEEQPPEGSAQPPTPTVPFSLEEPEKGINPLEMQTPSSSLRPHTTQGPASAAPPGAQEPMGGEEESEVGEEQTQPQAPSPWQPPQAAPPTQTPTPAQAAPQDNPIPDAETPEGAAPSSQQQGAKGRGAKAKTKQPLPPGLPPLASKKAKAAAKPAKTTQPSPKEAEKPMPSGPAKPKGTVPSPPKKADEETPPSSTTPGQVATPLPPAAFKGTPSARQEQKDTFFAQMKKAPSSKQTPPTPEEEQAAVEGIPAPAQPFGQITPSKDKEKGKEKIEDTSAASALAASSAEPTVTQSLQIPSIETTTPPSYAYLHPQVMDLFERMVGVMTILSTSGITETTITLNAPQFAASVFYGAQIIIQEFSTAPNAYNIQLIGAPPAVALFQANANDLMAAFASGNYNFKINRLEAVLPSSERPLFRRKEGTGGEQGSSEKGKK